MRSWRIGSFAGWRHGIIQPGYDLELLLGPVEADMKPNFVAGPGRRLEPGRRLLYARRLGRLDDSDEELYLLGQLRDLFPQ